MLHHLCWADDLYAMAGTMNHLTRFLEDMTNAIERLGMRSLWPDSSRNTINHACKLWQNETCAYCCVADGELSERCERPQILGRICDMALRRNVERRIHQIVQGRPLEQHAVETPSPRQTDLLGTTFHAFLAWIPKLKACNTWTEWLSLTIEFEYSWHVMLNLEPPESSSVCDPPVERSKRPRDDSDPWNVAWPSDAHRRLEVLKNNKFVINWINGAWEVKGDEHAIPVRGVVDQLVRWFLGGTFRPRTDESDWCRHIFRESNKAADTHANWLMDNGDSGPGTQWEAPDLHDKKQKITSYSAVFRWGHKGERTWCGCLDTVVAG